MTQQLSAELLSVRQLFQDTNTVYEIPIYQRNYAWGAPEIQQLINDIYDAWHDGVDENSGNSDGSNEYTYFIGNLIATKNEHDNLSVVTYEVVDGQQRLTTLFLLMAALKVDQLDFSGSLRYQSRPSSLDALRSIVQAKERPTTSDNLSDSGVLQGYAEVHKYLPEKLKTGKDTESYRNYLLDNVLMVRALLPAHTDLNRYFEIMNTRGQQLQQVDIVKARLMAVLPPDQQATFAWIWDACADMDCYVQMSLTPNNTKLRNHIFGPDWAWLQINDFAELLQLNNGLSETKNNFQPNQNLSARTELHPYSASGPIGLDEAILKYQRMASTTGEEDEDNVRFRSTIQFPVFLLHALKVFNTPTNADTENNPLDEDGDLDDKKLIERFPFPQGFEVPRIVFNYLDYLLVSNKTSGGYDSNFRFGFRNSIEHFYPQNLDKEQEADYVSENSINLFGNLALISVSANSRFSNNPPVNKAKFKDIVSQSPKLQIMAKMALSEGWGDEQVELHHRAMLQILKDDAGNWAN